MSGKVISILNDTHVLISYDSDLQVDQTVEVLGEIELPQESISNELKDLTKITYPKGKLIIISAQGNSVFLATTSRTKEEKKIIHKNNFALNGRCSLFGPTEEIVTEVPINSPAKLDSTTSLNLKISKIIKIGDTVRRPY